MQNCFFFKFVYCLLKINHEKIKNVELYFYLANYMQVNFMFSK